MSRLHAIDGPFLRLPLRRQNLHLRGSPEEAEPSCDTTDTFAMVNAPRKNSACGNGGRSRPLRLD